MTRRRWIADTWTNSTATLTGSQANHLFRVLRAEAGMEFDVLAGEHVWRSVIASASEAVVEFELLEEVAASSALPLTVLLSVFKFDRFEWAVEKLTELGVARIEPVISRRTEKHLAQAAINRVERWRRIAIEAAKQSRRASIPAIDDPRQLRDAILSADKTAYRLLLAEQQVEHSLFSTLQAQSVNDTGEFVLAIGPEGGWTPEELLLFGEQEWQALTLGTTILRAETAAIAATAITAAWLQK
jgi:16S rRNA (uracil1498-N3)-methyltransferase